MFAEPAGYLLLAQVVARAAGEPYERYLGRMFFAPLGMKDTLVRLPATDAAIAPRAHGFLERADGTRRAMDQIPDFYPIGSGGIYSTTADLRRWIDGIAGGKLLTAGSWRLMTTPAKLSSGEAVPYGFGLKLVDSATGEPMVTHGGDWRGFKADVTWLPKTRTQIILLTNNSQDDSVEAARDAVERLLAGRPVAPLRESVHRALFKRSRDATAAQLKTWLREQHALPEPVYDFPAQPLEQVAGELLRREQTDKAIAILEFNRDIHPDSLGALDALAEALEDTGNRAGAIAQVEALLRLRPDSRRVRERLQKLRQAAP